jgi:hypothetical protein
MYVLCGRLLYFAQKRNYRESSDYLVVGGIFLLPIPGVFLPMLPVDTLAKTATYAVLTTYQICGVFDV